MRLCQACIGSQKSANAALQQLYVVLHITKHLTACNRKLSTQTCTILGTASESDTTRSVQSVHNASLVCSLQKSKLGIVEGSNVLPPDLQLTCAIASR
jgi:hypothetical protein